MLTHLTGNLIDNAIRHNQPGGWIHVATDTDTGTGTARLVIENCGPIVDPSRVDELAQPFRRAVRDRTTANDTGVGLGLSIVAAITTTHHGTLDLHARPHGGLRVTVTLPLAARPCPRRGSSIMRVLVVEDVHGLADDIAEGLRDEGFAVDVAYNGLDAAAKLDTNAYQVVVLDRDLPGIHGDTLCRMITESDRPAMTLMLTASGTADDRISGLGLGADDYLTKPFHFTELVLRIRALARRQPTARPRVYHAADLTLDPQRHAATRDGGPSTFPSRSSASSRPCCAPRPPSSAPKSCSSRSGTKTPILSPTPSSTPSADCAANSATRPHRDPARRRLPHHRLGRAAASLIPAVRSARISPPELHTLGHLLINELVFACGYSSASLRERLYVSDSPSPEMAGLLIYTAAGDSEGTMGGLVRMARPSAFHASTRPST